MANAAKKKPHYVNNRDFSEAVMDYATAAQKARKENSQIPKVTDYILSLTQICYFAFIRRIAKEKKQQDIKFKFIEKMGIEDFVQMGMDSEGAEQTMNYVDTLRARINKVQDKDKAIKEFAKEEKKKEKAQKLELFMG